MNAHGLHSHLFQEQLDNLDEEFDDMDPMEEDGDDDVCLAFMKTVCF